MTFSVRFHGRGGQGVVTSAEMLSVAAFKEGRHAQAFPTFGSERMGAPVVSYCRIDDHPIRAHDPVTVPDAVVVQDPTLLHQPGVLDGLGDAGFLLVNTSRALSELGIGEFLDQMDPKRCVAVPAGELSRARLGKVLPNTALLGALAALTGVVGLEPIQLAVRERFEGGIGDANAALVADGFSQTEAVLAVRHA